MRVQVEQIEYLVQQDTIAQEEQVVVLFVRLEVIVLEVQINLYVQLEHIQMEQERAVVQHVLLVRIIQQLEILHVQHVKRDIIVPVVKRCNVRPVRMRRKDRPDVALVRRVPILLPAQVVVRRVRQGLTRAKELRSAVRVEKENTPQRDPLRVRHVKPGTIVKTV